VLRKHQPDHVLLRAARADAATGLLDIRRLSDMLARIKGRIVYKELDHVSPLAVPVMLEIGREAVYGEASDELLAEAAEELVKEAMARDCDAKRMTIAAAILSAPMPSPSRASLSPRSVRRAGVGRRTPARGHPTFIWRGLDYARAACLQAAERTQTATWRGSPR